MSYVNGSQNPGQSITLNKSSMVGKKTQGIEEGKAILAVVIDGICSVDSLQITQKD